MKESIVILLMFLLVPKAICQQDPTFSHYFLTPLYYNPSVAGLNDKWTEVSVLNRSQWVGYEGSFDQTTPPTTQLITCSMPFVFRENNFGIGISGYYDELTPQKNTVVDVSLAYHLKMKYGKLSLGVNAGVFNQVIDFDVLRYRDQNDPIYSTQGVSSQFVPDFDFGMNFQSVDFFASMAVSHLLSPVVPIVNTTSDDYRLGRNVNLIFGGYFDVNRDLKLSPSILFLSDFSSFSIEGTVLADYRERVLAALSVRNGESLIVLLGVYPLRNSQKLRITYSSDFVIRDTQSKQLTSHEIQLTFRIPVKSLTGDLQLRTPRYIHK